MIKAKLLFQYSKERVSIPANSKGKTHKACFLLFFFKIEVSLPYRHFLQLTVENVTSSSGHGSLILIIIKPKIFFS